jgi:aryl-alcohol dehydrogenase-like predicted oxidoreductase
MDDEATAVHASRRVDGWALPPIGFGAMLLGLEGRPSEREAIRTIHAALDAGARLIDTAINYCADETELGYCEALVGRALSSWTGDSSTVLVVCKGGNTRTATEQFVQDARPESLKASCETSLRALGTDVIGLYMRHAVDPAVPLVESMAALADLRAAGKIDLIGVSNAGRGQLAEAQTIVEIAAVENQLSPLARRSLPILRVCAEMNIAYLAYSPLGGAENAARIGDVVPALSSIAKQRGVSAQQVALAWSLQQDPVVMPIPAARRPETIADSLQAAGLRLTPEEMALIDSPD